MRDFVHSRDYNERQVGKDRPDPMSATEWLVVLSAVVGLTVSLILLVRLIVNIVTG